MARPRQQVPTDSELAVLHSLWKRGVCTVRDIHDDLLLTREIAYSSVSKTVSVMIEKGTVRVVDERRPQRVEAAIERDSTLDGLLRQLRNAVFGGSLTSLVSHLLRSGKDEDVKEVQEAISRFKKDRSSRK